MRAAAALRGRPTCPPAKLKMWIEPGAMRVSSFQGDIRLARTICRFAVVFAFCMTCFASVHAAGRVQSWRIDEAQTWIGFKIEAAGFPTTQGHFAHYKGQILIDFDRPAKSYTNFTVDSASVDVGSPAFNNFIKSAALLDVEKFPTMSFSSTLVEKIDAHTARIRGDLTMLGVSRPITLIVNVDTDSAAKGRGVSFVAKGTIVRSEFGMKFGIPLIDDTLEITVKTRAVSDE